GPSAERLVVRRLGLRLALRPAFRQTLPAALPAAVARPAGPHHRPAAAPGRGRQPAGQPHPDRPAALVRHVDRRRCRADPRPDPDRGPLTMPIATFTRT